MKKVGILGTGPVGKALTAGFIKYGYDVFCGSRSPEKLDEWKTEFSNDLKTGTFEQTAEYGDVLVLAVTGRAAEELVISLGASRLGGKTILDATNPISDYNAENGVLKYFTEQNTSLMERLQNAVPEANFVKAYSSITSAFMVDPPFDARPTQFICGNNSAAKAEAAEIIQQFGHDVEDMGEATSARAIEPLAMLFCIPGFRENRWTHAFRLMKL